MLRVTWRQRPEPMWKRPEEMPELMYELLLRRGMKSLEDARSFLNPERRHIRSPFSLIDMDKAADRIRRAVEKGEKICVYGDYDVDGVCATAILLTQLRKMGADCDFYIPSRHKEGYGLNEAAVGEIAEKYGLLVTLDCGVTSVDMVKAAGAAGLDCVVTDHHTPGPELPDCPVVNPMLGDYPFPGLCGAGVAMKVAMALRGEEALWDTIDLAALATVADVMPLMDENRAIVALGLQKMNDSPRPAISALMKEARLEGKKIAAHTLAYQLGPRINASGRMGDAARALRMLLAETETEAAPFAAELEAENRNRKSEETRTLREAEAQMAGFDFVSRRAIVLAGEDWNIGVVGLVAGRMKEKYGYPSVALTRRGEELTGSCRSIEGVNIHQALTLCQDLLIHYGGHKMAAGLSLKPENLEAFKARLDEVIRSLSQPEDFIPQVEYDMEYPIHRLSMEGVEMLERMEPCGAGNPPPLFSARAQVAAARPVGQGEHLKLTLRSEEKNVEGIWFGAGSRVSQLTGEEISVAYCPSINRFMGRASLQCEIKQALPDSGRQAERGFIPKERKLQCAYLTNVLYNENIIFPESAGACPVIGEAQVEAMLRESPQGILVVAFGDSAFSLPNAEYLVGRWPDPEGAYNAVCVCPKGEMPGGYRHVIAWDLPPELVPGAGMWTGRWASFCERILDLEGMRCLYRRLRGGEEPGEMEDLAAMGVLEKLGLIGWGWQEGSISILPSGRVDMEKDKGYCRLQAAKRTVQRRRGVR